MVAAVDEGQRIREARARALMAAVWAAGNLLIAGLLIAFADGSATGRLLGVLGGCLVVGLLIAVCLIAVNLSLGRHPDRSDAGGASDFLTVAAGFVGLAALVLGVLLGRPFGAVALGLGLLWLVQFGALLVIALGTRSAARRPRAAARAAAQSERGSRLG
jgi:hypothetical protein